jgi:N-acetylglutamate synthase-like GNAT family acetyltransferase
VVAPKDLEWIHRAFIEMNWAFAREMNGAKRTTIGKATAVKSRVETKIANFLFIPDPVPHPENLVERAVDYFDEKYAWRAVCPALAMPSIDARLRAIHFRPRPSEPGMFLRIDRESVRENYYSGMNVLEVDHRAEFADFQAVLSEAFKIPDWGLELVLPRIPVDYGDVKTKLLVGYINRTPIATAALTVVGRVAGLSQIGVLPGSRRHGRGSEITASAVDLAGRMGADLAFLVATEMGEPLYRKLGFETVEDYFPYERGGVVRFLLGR